MIELHIVGCYGSRMGKCEPTSYLIKGNCGNITLDAGSICRTNEKTQREITSALITHSHSDHWIDLQLLAGNKMNFLHDDDFKNVKVYATSPTIDAILKDGFQCESWEPFHTFKIDGKVPIELIKIKENQEYWLDNHKINAYPGIHKKGAVAYLIEDCDDNDSILYTGDTGVLDEDWWKQFQNVDKLWAVIIETSYPKRLTTSHALPFKHLSTEQVATQIKMLNRPEVKFYATHMKPMFENEINDELAELNKNGLNVQPLEQGKCYKIGEKTEILDSLIVR